MKWEKQKHSDILEFIEGKKYDATATNNPEWIIAFVNKWNELYMKPGAGDQIRIFIQNLLQEVGEKCVGEGDVCNEEMFVTEDNGIEHDNGAKFFSNGWNFNRDKVKSTLQKYGVVIK